MCVYGRVLDHLGVGGKAKGGERFGGGGFRGGNGGNNRGQRVPTKRILLLTAVRHANAQNECQL